ncbi:MAG: methyltransferase domain-containing protein [Candidatus Azobacteroides sp.]|nr:methyltransferase domain-containing protein [Candidatus Azobacteroides sp.]
MKALIRYVLNHVPRKYIHRIVHFFIPLFCLMYAGKKVQCPVCGRHFRRFMPYGHACSRDNALCPNCLSLERHRLMWLFLTNETDFFEKKYRLLHIAPEPCFMPHLEKYLGDQYLTADLESPLAKVKMDIQHIPLGENEVDIIFCNHILEHVENDRLAMREMFRVMRPGGWGIMLSPVVPGKKTTDEDSSLTTWEQRLKAYGQGDHLREYGEDYADRLTEAGFETEAIDYANRFSEKEFTTFGLCRDKIYRVKKPQQA